MSISNLQREKSRLYIFDELVICRFCSGDVFIPYEVYVNVEQPGIGCLYGQDVAICHHCGEVRHFGDPSYYDAEKDTYIWAIKQFPYSNKDAKK